MSVKKISTIVIAISFIVSQNISVNANTTINNERSLVNDVIMQGLRENATLYIGAELELKAFVNEEASIKNIEWLMNKENIVTLSSVGNAANIKAINEGEVSIMARAVDGSNSSRSINVQVRDFNKENSEVELPQGIVPIKSYGITNRVLQVEANRLLSSYERVKSIESYLNIISLNEGLILSGIDKSSYDNYAIYEIQVGGEENNKVEIRVDNRDTNSFDKIDNILNNLENYTNKVPLTPGMVYIDGNGQDESPYIVEANKNITSAEKIEAVKGYLVELYEWGELEVVNIREDERYTNYKIKIFRNHNRNKIKNDFYIEIRVDKHDKDSYLPIITMLNKINKYDSDNPTSNNDTNNNLEQNTSGDKENNNLNSNDNNSSSMNDNNSNNNESDNVENNLIENEISNHHTDKNNVDNVEENYSEENNIVEIDSKDEGASNSIQNLRWKSTYKKDENSNNYILSNINKNQDSEEISQEQVYKGLITTVVGISGTGLIIGKTLSINRRHKK